MRETRRHRFVIFRWSASSAPPWRATIALVALAVLIGAVPAAPADEVARGVVFDDRDGDGERDPGESGIVGVAVSNGDEVVTTDEDGRYEIPLAARQTLFVTKPSGYATPLDPNNLPLFWYAHFPEGTPAELDLRYPGIAPTGPLPDAIDFPLVRRAEPETFDVVLFADTQPQTDAELGFVKRTAIAPLVGTDAAFGMTLGDILFDDMSLFPRYIELIGAIGVPWYNVPGNHELNFLSPDDEHSLETFKRYFGPPYYSFTYANAHFVVLEDVDYLGKDVGRDPPHPRGIGTYEGRIGERQLRWLKRDLELVPEDRLIVLTMHIPLGNDMAPDAKSIRVDDRRELFEILSGREHLMAFAGHTHTAEHHYYGADEGFTGPGEFHQQTIATVSGSWWSGPMDARGVPVSWQRDGSPNGYSVLTVDDNVPSVRFVPIGAPAGPPLRIVFDGVFHGYGDDVSRDYRHGELLDARIDLDAVPATEVIVNLFAGGPRSRVTMRIGDREPTEMARERRIDPFIDELFARHGESLKSWVRPVPSSHLFVADLPDDLEAGLHLVEVRAVDEYGSEHVARAVLEVDGR